MLRQHTIYSLLFRSLETFIIVLRMAHEEDIRRWLSINSAHTNLTNLSWAANMWCRHQEWGHRVVWSGVRTMGNITSSNQPLDTVNVKSISVKYF